MDDENKRGGLKWGKVFCTCLVQLRWLLSEGGENLDFFLPLENKIC